MRIPIVLALLSAAAVPAQADIAGTAQVIDGYDRHRWRARTP
jgi:hypothetical protein